MTRRGTIMPGAPSFTALQQAPPASISFVLPPQTPQPPPAPPAPQAPQMPPAATSFAMPQHVSDWITGLYAQQPQVAPRSKNEWSHPLLPDVATCHYCVSATACPCFWVHLSADKLLRENGHASDGLSTCYAGLLSGIICAPALFCIDRSATHSLNGMMDRYDDVPAHDDDEEDNFDTIKHSLLAAGGFGTQHEWTNDGKGFDIDDWSEACFTFMKHADPRCNLTLDATRTGGRRDGAATIAIDPSAATFCDAAHATARRTRPCASRSCAARCTRCACAPPPSSCVAAPYRPATSRRRASTLRQGVSFARRARWCRPTKK